MTITLDLLIPRSTDAEFDQRNAACAGDPNQEAWFPYPSQGFDYAKGICARCPIRRECGDFAVATHQSGVWGGAEYDRGEQKRS